MRVNYPAPAIGTLTNELLEKIHYARELSTAASAKKELLELYTKVETEVLTLKAILKSNNFSTEYTNQLAKDLNNLLGTFTRNGVRPIVLQPDEIPIQRMQQERDQPAIEEAFFLFQMTANFFTKLDFLNRDLVIVGANGSGKTLLAHELGGHIKGNGVIISSQRSLLLPEFNSVKSSSQALGELRELQLANKTNKDINIEQLQEEFSVLIQALLADENRFNKEYTKRASENAKNGLLTETPSESNLKKLITLWNSLFVTRKIAEDGINIFVRGDSSAYPVIKMSEGEKVALFIIAQVLLAPERGFVIIDEPEIYLHASIHKKLWDQLEYHRPDLKFIYITHDLEFATSRIRAKKLWLRSYDFLGVYDIEEIPKNEIPETLLLELLGSKQSILFCEGNNESYDEKIYGILFPDFIIKPVGGCLSVIDYTKAFNKLPNTLKAVGVIDRDYHEQKRLELLKRNRVFGTGVTQVENLFFIEPVLAAVAEVLGKPEMINKIKSNILTQLDREKDIQVAKFVSTKVDLYFKDANISAASNFHNLKLNFEKFLQPVSKDMEDWAKHRADEITAIVRKSDYNGAIQIFKNKGLESIANKHLKISNFIERAIEIVAKSNILQNEVRKHLPIF
jgi:ABC-type cobalamin/Fe3+-siderophores transport system ATPase subunit